MLLRGLHVFAVENCFQSLYLGFELPIDLVYILDFGNMSFQVADQIFTLRSQLITRLLQVFDSVLSHAVLLAYFLELQH